MLTWSKSKAFSALPCGILPNPLFEVTVGFLHHQCALVACASNAECMPPKVSDGVLRQEAMSQISGCQDYWVIRSSTVQKIAVKRRYDRIFEGRGVYTKTNLETNPLCRSLSQLALYDTSREVPPDVAPSYVDPAGKTHAKTWLPSWRLPSSLGTRPASAVQNDCRSHNFVSPLILALASRMQLNFGSLVVQSL